MTTAVTQFTDKQTVFLAALFGEAKGNVAEAGRIAEYSEGYAYQIVKSLKTEIISRAENILALNAPKAAMKIVDGIDASTDTPSSRSQLDCAKTVLDRVGLGKREKIEIDATLTVGVIILPPKDIIDVTPDA